MVAAVVGVVALVGGLQHADPGAPAAAAPVAETVREFPLPDGYNHFVVATAAEKLDTDGLQLLPYGSDPTRAPRRPRTVVSGDTPSWADHPAVVDAVPVAPGRIRVTTTLDRLGLAALTGTSAIEDDVMFGGFSDDPLTHLQWGHENSGQTIQGWTGVADADTDAPEHWGRSRGAGVVVAAIDGGFENGHPDLQGAIWTNPAEVCGNGADDDSNGYVDDCNGWDFYDGDGDVGDGSANDHGTHIAGIIAARADNGAGVAGVAPEAKVMTLKAGDQNRIWSSAAAAAVDYAVANGADIISMSFGSPPGYYSTNPAPYLAAAIGRAEAAGIVVTIAAGNSAADIDAHPVWPASTPNANVVAVGSSDNRDRKSSFSNWGARTVDLFGPGSHIMSSLTGGRYGYMSGTSMAAPYVAGVAALLLSEEPALRGQALVERLVAGSEVLEALAGTCSSSARLNVGAPPTPVTFSFAGLDQLAADQAATIAVTAAVRADAALPAPEDRAVRLTLAAWAGAWTVVVDHPVAAGGEETHTDDEGTVVVAPEGDTAAIELALPPGTYALMSELVDAADSNRPVGRPSAVAFTVPDAAGQPPPTPTPIEPPVGPAPSPSPPPPGTEPVPAPAQPTAPTSPSPQPGATPPPPGAPAPGPDPAAPGAPTSPAPSPPPPTTTTTPTTPPVPAAPPGSAPAPAQPPPPPQSRPGRGTAPAPMPTQPTLPGAPGTRPPVPPSRPVQPAPPLRPLPPPAAPSTGPYRLQSVSPAWGPTSGGTLISIVGSGLPSRVYVKVGDVPATVVASFPTSVFAVTGIQVTPGTYDVTVTGADGTRDVLRAAFTYLATAVPAPVEPTAPTPTPTTAPPAPAPAPGTEPPSPVPTTAPPAPPPPPARPRMTLPSGLVVRALPEGSPLHALSPAAVCRSAVCPGLVL